MINSERAVVAQGIKRKRKRMTKLTQRLVKGKDLEEDEITSVRRYKNYENLEKRNTRYQTALKA